MNLWLAPLVAGSLALLALHLLLTRPPAWLPQDRPNERSLHAQVTPRIGGLGIWVGLLGAAGLLEAPWPWLVPALGLAALSFFDDRHDLPVGLRFLAHFLAAGAFLAWSGLDLPLWLLAGLLLGMVWSTNLYNFMDGANGLAGGMALFGFGFLGAAALLGDDPALAAAAGSIAAAALGFLRYNLHPARTFLGDAGSIPLGFLAAAIGILGWQRGLWSPFFPLALFAPFWVDATLTLARRGGRGERVWQAHREHYYQRLVRMGWSHRRLAFAEYALMALTGAVALWAETLPRPWPLLGLLLLYPALMVWVDLRWVRQVSAQARQ